MHFSCGLRLPYLASAYLVIGTDPSHSEKEKYCLGMTNPKKDTPTGVEEIECTAEPPVVSVRFISKEIGISVFALRDFKKDDMIYSERTGFEAKHSDMRGGTRTAYEQYIKLPQDTLNALHGAFPRLAAANKGMCDALSPRRPLSQEVPVDCSLTDRLTVDPGVGASHRHLIGSRIERGGSVSIDITEAQYKHSELRNDMLFGPEADVDLIVCVVGGYEGRTARWKRFCAKGLGLDHRPGKNPSRETVEVFNSHCFWLNPAATLSDEWDHAAIFCLTSLINHNCSGHHNCKIRISLGRVEVRANKQIKASEELTLDYPCLQCPRKCHPRPRRRWISRLFRRA
jgi:hypothetical protein